MRRQANKGTVYLVGAGPGAPDLITLRGLRLLRQADTLVYDRLVHPELIEEAPAEAERIFVGKEADRHTCSQARINDLLIERALANRVVVRLKGGDPFVFGRGGEECLALAEAGIAFEVVPGITSAVSVPAFAGIPVTHRSVSSSFTVVTGHPCDTEVDWAAFPKTGTMVILMGLRNLPEIARSLVESGWAACTPVAVIYSGSTEKQQTIVGDLTDIGLKARGLAPPATIVVGEVVRLHHSLNWFTPPATGDGATMRSEHPFISVRSVNPSPTLQPRISSVLSLTPHRSLVV
jgi:uroporphyrin-III C-methyltransferase